MFARSLARLGGHGKSSTWVTSTLGNNPGQQPAAVLATGIALAGGVFYFYSRVLAQAHQLKAKNAAKHHHKDDHHNDSHH